MPFLQGILHYIELTTSMFIPIGLCVPGFTMV